MPITGLFTLVKMRLKTGPVVYRRRTARRRPHSVVRRYLPCLLRTTGSSDTDSEYDTQLSSLLDHQHQQPIAEVDSPMHRAAAISCDTMRGAHESPTLERLPESTVVENRSLVSATNENLQLPLFRGRHHRWYASFGQYDNLTPTLTPTSAVTNSTPLNTTRVTNHVTSDVDDLLVDNLFMSLFDNFTSGGALVDTGDVTRQHETDVAARLASTLTSRDNDEQAATCDVSGGVTTPQQHHEHHDVLADLSTQPSDDVAGTQPTSDTGSEVNHSLASSDRSRSGTSTASSQRTVRHYYDERFRPGGVLSAVRFGRSLSVVCPPSYDDIVAITAVETPSCREVPQQQQQLQLQQQQPLLPPPPYNAMSDDPPAYSDVMNEHVVPVVMRSTPGNCTPFNGRLAVRWNSNSRVERWASSVNWITTS